MDERVDGRTVSVRVIDQTLYRRLDTNRGDRFGHHKCMTVGQTIDEKRKD